jgi:hypothetical protein
MITFQGIKQALHIRTLHSPLIIARVDIAGGRADHRQRLEAIGSVDGGECANHRAYRMPHEMNVSQAELFHDFEHIQTVSAERAVAACTECRRIRAARAHVIEQDYLVLIQEGRINMPPHALVAAVPMRKHDRLFAATEDFYVITMESGHMRHMVSSLLQTIREAIRLLRHRS